MAKIKPKELPVVVKARELPVSGARAQPVYEYQFDPGSGATSSTDSGKSEARPKPNNLAVSLKL